MVSTFDGYNYILRLNHGEKLSTALNEFLVTNNIDGASVTAIGGAEQLELGYYDLSAKTYIWQTFATLYEITSLQGTIALDEPGTPMFHLHGTFAGRDYQVIGGHVKDFVVGATCELFIHRTYQPLKRAHDDETGLKLLDL